MYSAGSRLATAILLVTLITCCVQAATIEVSVFEVAKNATMVPYAFVYVNGAMAGKTGSDGTLMITYPGAGEVEIKVTKPGYDDWFGSAGPNTSSVLAKLMKKNLSIIVDVYDADSLLPISGAVVDVTRSDSTVSGATDVNGTVALPVIAGMAYTVNINAIGYQTRTSPVEMGITGQSFQFPLLRDDRFSIVVRDEKDLTVLEDATVYIDGNVRGKTDSRGIINLQIPRDKVYNIKVVRTGYKDYSDKRLISSNEAIIPINLQRSPAKVVFLVIDENGHPVSGASILIDGTLRGTTAGNGQYSPLNLLDGDYSVEVKHPGFVTMKKQVVVGSQTGQLQMVLPFEDVNLTILVEDRNHRILQGARVSLDTNISDLTDNRGILQVKINPDTMYNITVLKEGYQTASAQKEIQLGNTSSTLTVTLDPAIDYILVLEVGIIAVIVVVALLLIIRRMNRNRGKHGGKEKGKGL